jgi:thioredoxin reductase (NADPH)
VIDLLIIGGGPAGLTSAIYGGRAMINTLLLENGVMGGQIRNTYRIENYPGFIEITGEELTSKMMEQAEKSGAVIDEFDEIVSIKFSDEEKIIETASAIYKPLAVIITSGAKHRSLPIAQESKYYGKGIHYCELCDGFMYKDKNIIVVGDGNSAAEAAIYLSRYANNITLIHRRESIKTEKSIQDELYSIPKIKYMWDSEIVSDYGEIWPLINLRKIIYMQFRYYLMKCLVIFIKSLVFSLSAVDRLFAKYENKSGGKYIICHRFATGL